MSAVCLEVSGGRRAPPPAPRERLTLQLNRSLSEPGPPSLPSPTTTTAASSHNAQAAPFFLSPHPKRCKLESSTATTGSISLPTSPCAESGTLQRALVLSKVSTIDADGLQGRLAASRRAEMLIVDCRPFMSYNVSHIGGAINLNCSDRFNRRRLQQGKACLADLATTREGKEALRRRTARQVLVYDDATADVERVTQQHPLFLVLASLVEDNREPVLLLGECAAHVYALTHVLNSRVHSTRSAHAQPTLALAPLPGRIYTLCCCWFDFLNCTHTSIYR